MTDQKGNFNQGRGSYSGNYQNYGSQNRDFYQKNRNSSSGPNGNNAGYGAGAGAGPDGYSRQYGQNTNYQGNEPRPNNRNGSGFDNNGKGNNRGPNVVNVPWDQYELRKKSQHGSICTLLLTLGGWITFARNFVFNIIFLLLLFVVFGGYMAVTSLMDNGISLSSSTIEEVNDQLVPPEVLYFDLSGPISEMPFSSGGLNNLQRELEVALYGKQSHELIAIEKALNLVAQDKTIKKVILDLDQMGPINLSMAERIGKAMDNAKAVAKRNSEDGFEREVVVIGYGFSQAAYAIAAHADKIVMDSLGEIDFKGIAMSSLYFKDMLDNANITPYIFRAGHFKSAVEPFMFNGMSYDVRREYQAIAFKSWDLYRQSIAARKQTTKTNILPDAATYVQWINRSGGSRAQLQLSQGLVDEVMPLTTYFELLSTQVNTDYDAPYKPALITYQDYLLRHHFKQTGSKLNGTLSQVDVKEAALLASPFLSDSKAANLTTNAATSLVNTSISGLNDKVTTKGAMEFNEVQLISQAAKQIERRQKEGSKVVKGKGKVAVIYGIGEIMDVGEKPTDFTPDNIIPLIEDAQNDPEVQAVVLYLNSPGGSVLASERIRRAVETFQKFSLKPIVVSMNGTAASGAYWIASQAEKIFATPSTITGSIGVFGVTFGAHKLLNKYGAYQDGVVTNELALTAIAKEMPYTQQTMYNLSVENTYKDFIELVAKNRNLVANTYEVFAEGQIFLAQEAQTLGLVDYLGPLSDAVAYAAKQANINPQGVIVEHKAPGSGSNMGIFDSIMFGFAQSYLPNELTYSLVKMRQVSKMTEQSRPAIMAISPVTEPTL